MQELGRILVGHVARAGDVATRLAVVRDDPELDRIAHADHHDRYRLRCLHQGTGGGQGLDENQLWSLSDELGCRGRKAFVSAFRRSRFQHFDVATVDPAELFQLRSNLTEESLHVGPRKQGKKPDTARLARALRAQAG